MGLSVGRLAAPFLYEERQRSSSNHHRYWGTAQLFWDTIPINKEKLLLQICPFEEEINIVSPRYHAGEYQRRGQEGKDPVVEYTNREIAEILAKL